MKYPHVKTDNRWSFPIITLLYHLLILFLNYKIRITLKTVFKILHFINLGKVQLHLKMNLIIISGIWQGYIMVENTEVLE